MKYAGFTDLPSLVFPHVPIREIPMHIVRKYLEFARLYYFFSASIPTTPLME